MSLAEEIRRFFSESKNPILFAGAGVSARAGLPVWAKYLEILAEGIRTDDELTCNQILEAVKDADYTAAASYYMMSRKVRIADKLEGLARPFEKYDVTQIQCIAGLPFQAYVTTNFDRALLSLYAKANGDAPLTFDLGDPALAAAAFRAEFFVSRVHGRVEAPQSMVLATEHYKDLPGNDAYNTFLRNIVGFKNVLFIGFSFFDPAIRDVLELVHREVGPLIKGRHTALLPSNISGEFIQKLEQLNIRRVTYSPDTSHAALWEAICAAAKGQAVSMSSTKSEPAAEPMGIARKYIAACYARSRVRAGLAALKDSVIEGVICNILDDAGGSGVTPAEIEAAVSRDLLISREASATIVGESLNRLRREGMCKKDQSTGRYVLAGDLRKGSLRETVQTLVDAVVDRYIVREQGKDSDAVRKVLHTFFDQVVIRRGWDLGAAFAAHRIPEPVEIERLLWESGRSLPEKIVQGLIYSAKSMFSSPTPAEAVLLEAIGRASFALELALQSPRDVLFHGFVLPQRVFLDANVLLPALTAGHAFEPVYRDSIQRLLYAANQAGVPVEVLVYEGFLNEVVSHRRIAKQIAAEAGEKLDDELTRQVRLFSSGNINVFLGAYANLKQIQTSLTFPEYLAENAPYETEKQLATWMADQGIKAVSIKVSEDEIPILNKIRHHLSVIFADDLSSGRRRDILIEHDGRQILGLMQAQREGRKVIFATADRALREGLSGTPFASVAQNMVSHVALPQLIDLLIGPSSDDTVREALGRMLWTTRVSSDYEVARKYFIDLALSKFDEAMAMNMGEAVERTATEAAEAARRQGVSLEHVGDRNTRAVSLLEQFEDGFFKGIREAIERRERQLGNPPPKNVG